jgi:hypothetical protein
MQSGGKGHEVAGEESKKVPTGGIVGGGKISFSDPGGGGLQGLRTNILTSDKDDHHLW